MARSSLSALITLGGACNRIRYSAAKSDWSSMKSQLSPARIKIARVVGHGVELRGASIHTGKIHCAADTENSDDDNELDEKEEMQYLRQICAIPDAGHHVMVIQPAVKWGPKKPVATNPQLQLLETCALVSTLPRWKVVRQKIVAVKQPDSLQLFGSGNLAELTREIRDCSDISAVVLGLDILTGSQLTMLQKEWNVSIFDRYTIVLQIFKDHARTKEAKLQIALAEIPFIRSRLSQIHEGSHDRQIGGHGVIGGLGDTYMSTRKHLLQEREIKLRKSLQRLKNQRQVLRQNRKRSDMPVVAVIGYTNAGKTSLIKALTGDAKLEPKDQLFATLDVTAHAGKLLNHMAVIYMDTVGFLSDIPLTLMEAFSATLEDAMLADLVIHVRDISHPDAEAQKLNVLQTLKRMLSNQLMSSMIEVWNKVDKAPDGLKDKFPSNAIMTSATTGAGLQELKGAIQDAVIQASGQLKKRFRIPMQGPMLSWLYKEATVHSAIPCESDSEHLIVEVVITKPAYERFKATFSADKKCKQST